MFYKDFKGNPLSARGFSTHASCEMLEKFLTCDDGFDMALMRLNFVGWEF